MAFLATRVPLRGRPPTAVRSETLSRACRAWIPAGAELLFVLCHRRLAFGRRRRIGARTCPASCTCVGPPLSSTMCKGLFRANPGSWSCGPALSCRNPRPHQPPLMPIPPQAGGHRQEYSLARL